MANTINVTGPISRKAGGLYSSVRHLCKALKTSDLDVHVFGVADEFSDADIAAWDPVPVSCFRPFLYKQFGYSSSFYQAAAQCRPDLVQTHGIWLYSSVVTTKLHRSFGTPYLISPHGMLDPWAVRNSRWKKRIAHLLFEGEHLRRASCIRALCESEAAAIRAYGLKNPIAIIPNGIDIPSLAVSPICGKRDSLEPESLHPVARLRAEGRKVLLYLGRIHPKKGLLNLVRAWGAVRRPEEWVLAIAGWDQEGHEEELQRLASALGIAWIEDRSGSANRTRSHETSVVFLGPQFGSDKAECYRACDAFILPSFSEGLPMVVLEAWAYGKPVLMTPACNLPEGFTAGAAQQIGTNPQEIQRGLEVLFAQSDSDRIAAGALGRNLAIQRFSWPNVAAEMKRVYEWILGGGNTLPASVRLN